ncbi:MAG: hypothetical protein CMI18_11235, partial [Opitutaceae bacterium]|nr:hypothetical protein [Opitutaceae bacterium]
MFLPGIAPIDRLFPPGKPLPAFESLAFPKYSLTRLNRGHGRGVTAQKFAVKGFTLGITPFRAEL